MTLTPARPGRPRYWTRAMVIAAIQHYADLYGDPPTYHGWNSDYLTSARERKRYAAHLWPSTSTVAHMFGSWSAAITAAGFPARGVGRPRKVAA